MSRPASLTRSSTVPRTVAALLSIIYAASRASAEDIRDIRGPQFIAPAWLLPALVAAFGVGSAAGGPRRPDYPSRWLYSVSRTSER